MIYKLTRSPKIWIFNGYHTYQHQITTLLQSGKVIFSRPSLSPTKPSDVKKKTSFHLTQPPSRLPSLSFRPKLTNMSRNFGFFSFLVFSLFSFVSSHDLQVLLNIKSSLLNSNPGVLASWKLNYVSAPCSFTGVTCDATGSVKEIDLSRQALSGKFPFASLCDLKSLQKLSLGFNSLSGTIPSDINNCTNLTYLDLGNNLFSGTFPEFSSLSHLQYLYLNNSAFSSVFPWKSLRNAKRLVVLSLGDNPFDTTPFPEEVVSLKSLTWLYLSNCSIAGKIPPAIGDLTELRNLEISDSDLTGEIPPEIVKLTKLRQLELYNNSLTGKLPRGFGSLTNLTRVDASMNYLEGDLSELRSLTNLSRVLYHFSWWAV